ncbi:diguanylate cyclase domain-containing protein [Halochromatium glycolicum]|uniref:diguanylate cyclase domain-containing protein n=1 Tax=Halochromatium glycolicum TaxID=85075 RepID=UPI003B82F66E
MCPRSTGRGRWSRLAERRAARSWTGSRLTGLAKRRLFTDRLAQTLARYRRTGERFSLHLLDLSHFKERRKNNRGIDWPVRRFLSKLIPPCWSFRSPSSSRRRSHSPAMLPATLLEGKRKSCAIRYELFRQSP